MGQQQLLLIVLGVVIVGIAIIAGITAYTQNNKKSDLDGLIHEAMRVASDLQAMGQKPEQFGGFLDTDPAGSELSVGYDFEDDASGTIDITKLGWDTDPAVGTYGEIEIQNPAASEATIQATSHKYGSGTAANVVTIQVCGPDAVDIKTAIGSTAPVC